MHFWIRKVFFFFFKVFVNNKKEWLGHCLFSLINKMKSKVCREFSHLSLPESHCSCAAKSPLLCNLPKGAENTVFPLNSDYPPLPWYKFGLKQQLHTRFFKCSVSKSFIVVFVARFTQELSNQHTPRMWAPSEFWFSSVVAELFSKAWLHKTYSLALSCFPTWYMVSYVTYKIKCAFQFLQMNK